MMVAKKKKCYPCSSQLKTSDVRGTHNFDRNFTRHCILIGDDYYLLLHTSRWCGCYIIQFLLKNDCQHEDDQQLLRYKLQSLTSFLILSFALLVCRSFLVCVLSCHLNLTFDRCYASYTCRYTANKSMNNCAFCNADGDFLIVPQKGSEFLTLFKVCGFLVHFQIFLHTEFKDSHMALNNTK